MMLVPWKSTKWNRKWQFTVPVPRKNCRQTISFYDFHMLWFCCVTSCPFYPLGDINRISCEPNFFKSCTFTILYRSSDGKGTWLLPFWVCEGFFEVYHLNGLERQQVPGSHPNLQLRVACCQGFRRPWAEGSLGSHFSKQLEILNLPGWDGRFGEPPKGGFLGLTTYRRNIRKPWLITIKSWMVPGNVHFLGMVGRVTLIDMNRVSVLLLWRVSIKHVWACLQCIHFMITCFSKPCTKMLVSILRQGGLLFWSALKCLGAPWILSILLPWVPIACQGFWWRVFEVPLTLRAV